MVVPWTPLTPSCNFARQFTTQDTALRHGFFQALGSDMKTFELLQVLAPAVAAAETKIRLARYNGKENPLDVYFDGNFEKWQRVQTRKNFRRPYVLSLIAIQRPHMWLFAGLHRSGPPTSTLSLTLVAENSM